MKACHWIWATGFVSCLINPVGTEAQDLNGDDLFLTDETPFIFFDDTNTAGNNYTLQGLDQYFSITDAGNSRTILVYEPALQNIALGSNAIASGSDSVAVGRNASATGDSATALGRDASAGGITSTALGYSANAVGFNATALGYVAYASGISSNALGFFANAGGNYSTALGYRAVAPNPDTIVLGPIPDINNATSYANVGIGTPAPIQAVDVERSGAAARFQLTSFTDTANEAPQYIQRRARGTRTGPFAVQINDNLGLFSFRGHNGITMGGSRATITAQAAGDFSANSTPTRLIFATTPVGQTAPQQVLVITPDGKLQVNGQNLNVPDYVFEEDYPLMPLEELRAFIETNGHLPGVASANEVINGSLDLVDTPLGNLRKIEELTLYTLHQQAELDSLRQFEQRNRELENEVSSLRTEVADLKKLVMLSLPQTARN